MSTLPEPPYSIDLAFKALMQNGYISRDVLENTMCNLAAIYNLLGNKRFRAFVDLLPDGYPEADIGDGIRLCDFVVDGDLHLDAKTAEANRKKWQVWHQANPYFTQTAHGCALTAKVDDTIRLTQVLQVNDSLYESRRDTCFDISFAQQTKYFPQIRSNPNLKVPVYQFGTQSESKPKSRSKSKSKSKTETEAQPEPEPEPQIEQFRGGFEAQTTIDPDMPFRVDNYNDGDYLEMIRQQSSIGRFNSNLSSKISNLEDKIQLVTSLQNQQKADELEQELQALRDLRKSAAPKIPVATCVLNFSGKRWSEQYINTFYSLGNVPLYIAMPVIMESCTIPVFDIASTYNNADFHWTSDFRHVVRFMYDLANFAQSKGTKKNKADQKLLGDGDTKADSDTKVDSDVQADGDAKVDAKAKYFIPEAADNGDLLQAGATASSVSHSQPADAAADQPFKVSQITLGGLSVENRVALRYMYMARINDFNIEYPQYKLGIFEDGDAQKGYSMTLYEYRLDHLKNAIDAFFIAKIGFDRDTTWNLLSKEDQYKDIPRDEFDAIYDEVEARWAKQAHAPGAPDCHSSPASHANVGM